MRQRRVQRQKSNVVQVRIEHPRRFACLVGALTVALATSAPGQSYPSADSDSRLYSQETRNTVVRLVQADFLEQPSEPDEPPEVERLDEVSEPAFESPFLASERPTRISRVPDMFGDFFAGGGQLTIQYDGNMQQFNLVSDVPLAGGSRRVKVGENNKALTDDRVYFLYNHFHNALRAQSNVPPFANFPGQIKRVHVDRYTFGFEKSFLDGLFSVEFRLPVSGTFRFDDESVIDPMNFAIMNVQGGKAGNLAVLLKGQLLSTDSSAVSFGCGIDLPTGSDVRANASFFMQPMAMVPPEVDELSLVIHNEALHLLPFLAVSHAPSDNLFFHLFVQADVAASSNPVEAMFMRVGGMGPQYVTNATIGEYTEQNLLHVDLAAGHWLFRGRDAGVIRGLAGLVEVHYTTAIQDSDLVKAFFPPFTSVKLTNGLNRVDVANLTAGVQLSLAGDSTIRVAGVVPVEKAVDNHFFDSEVWVSFIKQL